MWQSCPEQFPEYPILRLHTTKLRLEICQPPVAGRLFSSDSTGHQRLYILPRRMIPGTAQHLLHCPLIFALREKRRSQIKETVSTAYWLTAAAVYLGWSFWSDAWKTTWIVWPVAGVLFAAVMCLCNLLPHGRFRQGAAASFL